MRHPFIPQISLGATPIEEIQFDHTSRHELVPILMALQHLYVNCKVVMVHILSLIAEDISSGIDNKRGCTGMSHWENLVLTALRLGCNLNFDQFVQEKGIQIHLYWRGWIDELHFFIAGCEYACEISAQRMLAGKTLTNKEKTFSLFEPDTELINRGKRPNPIEFGHRVLIVEDNAGFILYGKQMGMGLTEEKVIVEVMQRLQDRFNGGIRAASFEKGF